MQNSKFFWGKVKSMSGAIYAFCNWELLNLYAHTGIIKKQYKDTLQTKQKPIQDVKRGKKKIKKNKPSVLKAQLQDTQVLTTENLKLIKT